RLLVSVFRASTPVSYARAIQCWRRSSVAIVSYFVVSSLVARNASSRRWAREIGVSPGEPGLAPAAALRGGGAPSGRCPWPLGRPEAAGEGAAITSGVTAGPEAESIWFASMPPFSATRCVNVLNPIALRNAISVL